jgi:hypothetical protein
MAAQWIGAMIEHYSIGGEHFSRKKKEFSELF